MYVKETSIQGPNVVLISSIPLFLLESTRQCSSQAPTTERCTVELINGQTDKWWNWGTAV